MANMSPARISFSYDQSDAPPPLSLSSSADFDFCVRRSFDQDSSSADELFSDGKILPKTPLPSKQKGKIPKSQHPPPQPQPEESKTQSNKSFWGFKRSSSLNCGSGYGYGYGPSLCPLPILSRSNSTGSVKTKTSDVPSLKQKSACNYHKPPLKKMYGSQRVNPVLNVPAVSIFGLFTSKRKAINK